MALDANKQWKAKRCVVVPFNSKHKQLLPKSRALHLSSHRRYPWGAVQRWVACLEWVVVQRWVACLEWGVAQKSLLVLTLALGVLTELQNKVVLNTNNSCSVFVILAKCSDE
jgi:hypothetical protein